MMIDEAVACVNNLQWDRTIVLYYAFSPNVAYITLQSSTIINT